MCCKTVESHSCIKHKCLIDGNPSMPRGTRACGSVNLASYIKETPALVCDGTK